MRCGLTNMTMFLFDITWYDNAPRNLTDHCLLAAGYSATAREADEGQSCQSCRVVSHFCSAHDIADANLPLDKQAKMMGDPGGMFDWEDETLQDETLDLQGKVRRCRLIMGGEHLSACFFCARTCTCLYLYGGDKD